jgi:phosphoribosylglycinamide formyltransferase-1
VSAARTAVLISGRGSNMMALVEAARAPDFPAEIALVLADRGDAAGLALAKAAGIATAAVDRKIFATRDAFEQSMRAMLEIHRIDLICLAGFMRVLSAPFVARWRGRMINIHPSLLPAFRGLDTHARALAAGVPTHGCTVHFVVAELDAGPIIAQASVPVLPGDTAQALAARVLDEEHRLYPLALSMLASGRASIDVAPALEAPLLEARAVR